MTIEAGTRLDQYRLVEKIGEGGMGVVWKAHDTSLDRDVAVKVLPESFAQDEDLLARFEREAKAVAALSHPNIVGIFGFGTASGRTYAAMELLEGQPLRDLLDNRPPPPRKAVDIARQIAVGLDAAHGKGIVHRDLKPDNVFVTADGRARILDFGLATARPGVESGHATSLATLPELTTPGTVMGTIGYMSPEQVRGEPADSRSDIFSLGTMLHEMLTREQPFRRPTQAETMTAILREDAPEVSLGERPAPPALARVVQRCLEKSADERFQSARDLAFALENTTLDSSPSALGGDGPGAGPGHARASVRRLRSPWLGARWIAVAVIAALGGWWMRGQQREPVETWTRFTQLTDEAGAETAPALSPDGGSFAYASRAAGSWDIYVQRVGGRNPIAVAADPERDEMWPAFSPDGSLIAYDESDGDGGIWIVGATGESNRRLTDFGFNPAWSPDGEHIAFVTEEARSPYSRPGFSYLWRVPAAGGEPVQLTEGDAMQPAWSPSGGRIAIWINEGGRRDLATVPADGGEYVVLLEDDPLDWSPRWSPDGGHLYFASDRGGSMGLWRLPIDESSGRARGAPELVAGGVEASIALPSFSADGRILAFRSETVSINPAVIPFDPVAERAGAPRELLRRTGILMPTSVSPDGSWIALANRGEEQEDLFLMRSDGSELRRLTDDPARDRDPKFSPDGTALSFFSNRSGAWAAHTIRTDGSALSLLTGPSVGEVASPSFEPGGERLLVEVLGGEALLVSPPWPATIESVSRLENVDLPAGTLVPGSWSPDGHLLSGVLRAASGAFTGIGVYDLRSGEGRQLSSDPDLGVLGAAWLPESRRLICLTREGELVILDVETTERRLIPVDLPSPPAAEQLAVASDGTALYYGAERIESNVWMLERDP